MTVAAAVLFALPPSYPSTSRRRRSAKRPADLLAPSKHRLRQGLVERLDKPIADTAGAVARPYRAIDILGAMERRGAITPEMRDAGERFRERFVTAHLNPLRAANIVRLGASGRTIEPGLKAEAAREHVWRAICAVGGLASPGGSCVWSVIGLELALKQWCTEQGWAGRPIREEIGSGILISALGALASYYRGSPRNGYGR